MRQQGQTLPNLRFIAEGQTRAQTLEDLRGRPVLLHFWGSWCPPCRRELPEIASHYAAFRERGVTVLLVNVREDATTARSWLRSQKLTLPVADAGADSDNEGKLWAGRNQTIGDRELSPTFPTTYLIGTDGRVLAAFRGPIADWRALLTQFDIPVAGSTAARATAPIAKH